jgi:pyruvate kinase
MPSWLPGDLDVETPLENIRQVQKMLIRKTNRSGKPVVTAGVPVGIPGTTNLIKAEKL